MSLQRSWVTPFTAGAFLLSAVTGVLIFFHVDSGLNKFAHEWLSWALLAGAALHTTVNFGALKNHLRSRRGQVLLGVFVIALGLSFIPAGNKGNGGPPFAASVRALAGADLPTLAQVAKVAPDDVRARLAEAGIRLSDETPTIAKAVGNDLHRQMEVLSAVLSAPQGAGSGHDDRNHSDRKLSEGK